MIALLALWVAFGLALAGPLFLIDKWRNRMPKTYGPDTVPEVPAVPFALRAVHEDPQTGQREIRTHEFIAKPDPSAGDFHRFALATKDTDGGALLIVLADILPRMIANDDGVPMQWEYRELPAGVRAEIAQEAGTELISGVIDDGDPVPNFRGPDGQIYPEPERKRFEEFGAGSSRRRLYNLMFEDKNVKVEMQTVAEIMKDLFAAAGKGRTSA